MKSSIKRLFKVISYFVTSTFHFFAGLMGHDRLEMLRSVSHTSFLRLASVSIVLASMGALASQVYAQSTVSGGSFMGNMEDTEIEETGTFQLFDSNLGTLTGVQITYSGFGQTEIEVENTSSTNANGDVTVLLHLWSKSTNSAINDLILTEPNIISDPGTPGIWSSPLEVLYPLDVTELEPGGNLSSGLVDMDNEEGFYISAGPPDFNDLSPFEQEGGGAFDMTCFSGTNLQTNMTGGNVAATQNTQASCGMEVTYYYDPAPTNITITEGPCWRTLASPEEQSYADFFAAFETNGTNYGGLYTQGSTGAQDPGGDPNVYTMNADGSDWVPVSDLTQTMEPGTGVLISVFEEDEPGNPSSSGFPKVAEFTGGGNPANFNLGDHDGTTGSSGGSATGDGGFSMLGNPFDTAIDFNALFDDAGTTGINQAAWVYDRNANSGSGGWISTNDVGLGDLTDGIIASGQGFVVQNTTSPSTPNVNFTEEVKVQEPGTFYGKENKKPDHLRIEVQGDDVYNSAWIQLSNNGSINETISGDVTQFYPFESEYAVLSTVKHGKMMDIGHFPYPGEQVSIPLTVETTSTKPMTLSLTDLQIGAVTPLYLHDTVTGKSIELIEGAEYTFTPNSTPIKAITGCLTAPVGLTGPLKKSNNTAPRFLINTDASINTGGTEQPSAYNLDQNYPNPFNPTTQITYQVPQESQVTLSVYDMSGREVATLVNDNVIAGTHTINFDASSLSSGVYMYRLHAGATILTRKLTLIK